MSQLMNTSDYLKKHSLANSQADGQIETFDENLISNEK